MLIKNIPNYLHKFHKFDKIKFNNSIYYLKYEK